MIARALAGTCLALVLAGCSAGRDFTRPPEDSLVIGKTTYAEIVQRYGSPFREATVLKNERNVKVASYAYATSSGEGVVGGITPARGAAFHFVDQVLVGHEFTSSFKADSTDFDETKVTDIKKGESTRAQVVTLLGPPVGLHVFPLVKREGDTAILYVYQQTRVEPIPFAPKIKVYRKQLLVTLDPAGVTTDVEYSASGEK